MNPADVVIVLTTWPAAGDPSRFASTLVEERLAACVNLLGEMESIYRWQGKVERERERQVIMKTTAGRLDELKRRLGELHPYDVPEMLVLPVAAGAEQYLAWVGESTGA